MNSQVTSKQEIEIKLDLGSFTNYLKLLGFLGQIDHEERQQNVFFDTEDRRLSKSGWALRVRVEDALGRITLKGTSSGSTGAAVREEIESEISQSLAHNIITGQSNLMSQDHDPITRAREIVGKRGVQLLVQFENVRMKKAMRLDDYDYVFEVDKTEFSDGSVEYELELELPDMSRVEAVSNRLERIFRSLDIPFEMQPDSKFARALRHSGLE